MSADDTNKIISQLENDKKAAQLGLDVAGLEARIIATRAANEAAELKAQVTSRIGTIAPTTQTPGEFESKQDAGRTEADCLVAAAIEEIAKDIAEKINDAIETSCVILYGDKQPTFQNVALFEIQKTACESLFSEAEKAFGAVETSAARKIAPEMMFRELSLATAAAVTNAVLDIGAGLASYLKTEYVFSGITPSSGIDDKLLAIALAGQLIAKNKTVCFPSLWNPSLGAFVDGELKELFASYSEAPTKRMDALEKAQATGVIPSQANAWKSVADLYQRAEKAFEDLLLALRTVDPAGVPWIAKVAEERAIRHRNTDDDKYDRFILVRLHSQGGGYYTANSLFGSLFRPPAYVGGGAVASYLVVDGSGKLVKAGQVQRHSNYDLITHIASRFARPRTNATSTGQPKGDQ